MRVQSELVQDGCNRNSGADVANLGQGFRYQTGGSTERKNCTDDEN